jgi:hypothetical protein
MSDWLTMPEELGAMLLRGECSALLATGLWRDEVRAQRERAEKAEARLTEPEPNLNGEPHVLDRHGVPWRERALTRGNILNHIARVTGAEDAQAGVYALKERAEKAEAELDKHRRTARIWCRFCGWDSTVTHDSREAMARETSQALAAHMAGCKKNPEARLRRQNRKLRELLEKAADLIDSATADYDSRGSGAAWDGVSHRLKIPGWFPDLRARLADIDKEGG